MYRFESLPLRQETLNDSELTETSGYKAGRFSFSGPARCDSRSGFPPIVPTVPAVPGASSVSGRTERTERTERRDMPRIGPFVLARSIDGSSFFFVICGDFAALPQTRTRKRQADGLSFAPDSETRCFHKC